MTYIAPHETLENLVRKETLRLFHRYIHPRYLESGMES